MVVESLLPTALTPNVSVDVEPLRQLFAPSNNETSPYALYAALIFAPLILTLAWDQLTGRKFPWAHPVFAYTPRWLSGIVWSLGSLDIMQKAYDKVRVELANLSAFRMGIHPRSFKEKPIALFGRTLI